MNEEPFDDTFDKGRAELFEALGHPLRIEILRALSEAPLGFADLKRKVGIASSGHLSHHLEKLDGLIGTTPAGTYSLTDDGKEALRIVEASGGTSRHRHELVHEDRKVIVSRAALACVLAAVVLLASAVVFQQIDAAGQSDSLSGFRALNDSLSSQVSSLQTKVDNSVPTYAYCGRNSAECGQRLAEVIQQDPRFVEQEHGLNFTFFTSGIGCQGCDISDPHIQLPYQLMFQAMVTNSSGTFRALLWAIVPESGIYFDLTAVTFQYSPPSILMQGG